MTDLWVRKRQRQNITNADDSSPQVSHYKCERQLKHDSHQEKTAVPVFQSTKNLTDESPNSIDRISPFKNSDPHMSSFRSPKCA